MRPLPDNVPLTWVLQMLPWSKRYLYNLKCSGKIDFLLNADGLGKPTKRLHVYLPKLCAYLLEQGRVDVTERVVNTVRKIVEASDGLIGSHDSWAVWSRPAPSPAVSEEDRPNTRRGRAGRACRRRDRGRQDRCAGAPARQAGSQTAGSGPAARGAAPRIARRRARVPSRRQRAARDRRGDQRATGRRAAAGARDPP